MKQHITKEQVMELSDAAQQRLAAWFDASMPNDDCLARVFIPEEKDGEFGGEFSGEWDSEHEFTFPEEYIGKLKNHQGAILPLLDIGQMIELLNENDLVFKITTDTTTCDHLWRLVKYLLEDDIVVSK